MPRKIDDKPINLRKAVADKQSLGILRHKMKAAQGMAEKPANKLKSILTTHKVGDLINEIFNPYNQGGSGSKRNKEAYEKVFLEEVNRQKGRKKRGPS